MKATSRMRKGKFTLTLTIEDEKEAQALYAIFNYSSNFDLLPRGAAEEIKDALGHQFYVTNPEHEIANGVTYSHFYRSKVNGR